MHVADGPVGVVREGIDGADGEERAFEGGHAVEGDGGDEEFDDRVRAEFIPCAAEGEEAVEHAAPAGGPEHEAEEHAEHLKPARQGGIEQVVRSGPDVDEHEGPEVDDGEAVAVDWPSGRFRHEVVHDAEDGSRQEEGDGIVAVPPLDESILDACEDGVAVRQAGGQRQVIDDVEHRDRDDGGDVEPEGHIEAWFISLLEGPEEIDREDDPDEGDGDVDGPDQFGVFLSAGESGREGDGGGHDDELPSPEVNGGEQVRGQSGFAEALGGIVDACEHHVADEGEDGGIGVKRAEAAEGEEFESIRLDGSEGDGLEESAVHLPPAELSGGDEAHEEADDAPDDGGEGEPPDGPVIELDGGFDCVCVHGWDWGNGPVRAGVLVPLIWWRKGRRAGAGSRVPGRCRGGAGVRPGRQSRRLRRGRG